MSKAYDHRYHSKGALKVHLIFVSRFRKKIITESFAEDVKACFRVIALRHNWTILEMETDKDHIHMLISYSPTDTVSNICRILKQQSTHMMYQKYSHFLRKNYWYQNTLWSKGYFYCSIGEASQETIERYIQNQG